MSEFVAESVETLAEVLADHFVMWHELPAGGPPGEWRCQCGQKFEFSDSAIRHQAEAITSGAVRPAAEVRGEALREFAGKWADWIAKGAPQARGGAAYRAICEAQSLEAALAEEADQ